MKFNQIKKTATTLTRLQTQNIKGGNTEAQDTTAIIITEDIDVM